MNHQSYIHLPPVKVVALATNTINQIHERRAGCAERFLKKRIEKMWLRRLLGKLPTVVELHEELEALRGVYFDSYHFIATYWADEEKTAHRLFAIAMNSTDSVRVTAADFAHIGMPLSDEG